MYLRRLIGVLSLSLLLSQQLLTQTPAKAPSSGSPAAQKSGAVQNDSAPWPVLWEEITFSRNGAANLILVFGIILGVLASFVAVSVRYALAIQACVVENLGSWVSMKRSVSLSKDGRLRIAAVCVLFLILSWIASVSFAWIARMAATSWHSRITSIVVIQVAGFVTGSLTAPLATIGISLLYL